MAESGSFNPTSTACLISDSDRSASTAAFFASAATRSASIAAFFASAAARSAAGSPHPEINVAMVINVRVVFFIFKFQI